MLTCTHQGTGVASAIVANRISYVFGMKGPSMTIDTVPQPPVANRMSSLTLGSLNYGVAPELSFDQEPPRFSGRLPPCRRPAWGAAAPRRGFRGQQAPRLRRQDFRSFVFVVQTQCGLQAGLASDEQKRLKYWVR